MDSGETVLYEHFNPRLREGGDRNDTGSGRFGNYFNPRLREGGDEEENRPTYLFVEFQSTPPRRRRQ